MMKFINKSDTLYELEKIIKTAIVLPQVSFSYKDYKKNKSDVMRKLKLAGYLEMPIIVRSCEISEDDNKSSQAGKFLSVGNVCGKDATCDAIDKVFSSMGEEENNKVFIQQFLQDVDMSGVLFTLEPNTGAHYFVINYDEITGTTNTVTDGKGRLLKTFYKFKSNYTTTHSKFERLFDLGYELESIFETQGLDIEFAIKGEQLYLLQVRPLTIEYPKINIQQQKSVLERIAKQIEMRKNAHPDVLGSYSIYGVMPDWNPAEMIGTHPRGLALSLYKEIITDCIWAYQRDNYGYRNMRSFPLMVDFCGMPYIDTRISFNSFIPKSLDNCIAQKLVEYYLEQLKKHPEYHDKIEFEIVFSCYTFDTESRIKKLLEYGFDEYECKEIINSLHKLTNEVIGKERGLWKKDLLKIDELKEKHNMIMNSNLELLDKIYWLLEYCKRYGTLPFAGIARAGFIAVEFLKSFTKEGILSEDDKDLFMNSLFTVGKMISFDSINMSKQEFMEKYGHLRPGTYNICSPCYAKTDSNYFDFERIEGSSVQGTEFIFTQVQLKKIEELIKKHKFNFDVETLLEFIRGAIEGREYAKFVFTKTLSEVIELIALLGEQHGFSRDDMSYVNIKSILAAVSKTNYDIKLIIDNAVREGKSVEKESISIILPMIMWDKSQIYEFYQLEGEPNYITNKSCEADVVCLPCQDRIEGKIVVLLNADPGFDWIFSHNISGFITAYGGINSHMAIRCAEFGIPAVIGVGEKAFFQYSKCKKIRIDCHNRKVERLQ